MYKRCTLYVYDALQCYCTNSNIMLDKCNYFILFGSRVLVIGVSYDLFCASVKSSLRSARAGDIADVAENSGGVASRSSHYKCSPRASPREQSSRGGVCFLIY